MRIVADTNTLVSGLLWHGAPRQLVNAARRRKVEIVATTALLAELAKVLSRDKFIAPIGRANLSVESLIADHARIAVVVEAAALLQPVCRDPDDDAVLAAALGGKVDLIVSGDRDLLDLGRFREIPIVTVGAALAVIE